MHNKHRVGLGLLIGVIAIMLLLSSSSEIVLSSTPENITSLEHAFIATGAELKEVSISGWVRVNTKETDLGALNDLAIRIAHELSEPESTVICNTISGSGQTTIRAITQNEKQNVTATVQVMEQLLNNPETYLLIDIEKKDGSTGIGCFEQKILGIIRKNGEQYTITTCLSGWVNGKLEEEKMTRLAKQAFLSVNGRVIEGINTPQFVSYAGITEAIDRSVCVGKNSINLNIAMRHNNIEQRTYVTAATPLITHEY